MPWTLSGTPARAKEVAAPERMEWLPTSGPRVLVKREMNQTEVGTMPAEVSQSSGWKGKKESREEMYRCMKGRRSKGMSSFARTTIVLPW
jgi:hypothetical protein